MVEPSRLVLFAAAAVALIATPGPNSIYIMTRGIGQGRRAAVVSALGVETADLLHIGAAALGISALITSSAIAFTTLKYLGAAYLVYLGIKTFRSTDVIDIEATSTTSLKRVYWQGFVVNTLNPKVALFFLAFLPQFVDASRGSVPRQILLLGAVFVLIGVMFDMIYALVSGSLGLFLRRNPAFLRRQRYLSGAVYVGLGLSAAMTGGNRPSV